jgi:hypothetical protein
MSFAHTVSEKSNTPSVVEQPKVTAVPAVVLLSGQHKMIHHDSPKASSTSNKRITRKKVIRILLDSLIETFGSTRKEP